MGGQGSLIAGAEVFLCEVLFKLNPICLVDCIMNAPGPKMLFISRRFQSSKILWLFKARIRRKMPA